MPCTSALALSRRSSTPLQVVFIDATGAWTYDTCGPATSKRSLADKPVWIAREGSDAAWRRRAYPSAAGASPARWLAVWRSLAALGLLAGLIAPGGLGVRVGVAHAAAGTPRAGDFFGLPPRFEITWPLPPQGIHSRGSWDPSVPLSALAVSSATSRPG